MIKKFPNNLKLKIKDIAKGGGGILSLYEDEETKKKYMIKELYKKNTRQYINLLHLKNICKDFFLCPYGLFEKNGKYYIITEYLDGYLTLSQTKKIFPLSIKKKILKKIKYEINILHKKKMTHNDLKPSNIMVEPQTKKVRIIDFGSAIIHSPSEKYKLKNVGYTKKYTKLDPNKYYSKSEFIENDLYAFSIISSWYLQ